LVELADTSAWTNRDKDPQVLADFTRRVESGRIATCAMVVLELLWSARDHGQFVARRRRYHVLEDAPIDARVWHRATDVFEILAAEGPVHHRRVALPDLVIAAAAEVAEIGLCHYDGDFDVIAAVTGQPVRPIAPLGSL
jgi:predicted nucleic acid-binding protein